MPEFLKVSEIIAAVEAAGIWVTLIAIAWEIRQNTRAARFTSHAKIVERFQELQAQIVLRPELAEITSTDATVVNGEVPAEFDSYVRQVISHSHLTFHTPEIEALLPRERFQNDVGRFFQLPLPNAVWLSVREYYDDDFVEFVEAALRSGGA